MSDKKKNQKEFGIEDSVFDLRIKQYKKTLPFSIIGFILTAGVFAGGMVIIFIDAWGLVLLVFSFILLFLAVNFLGVYIQSNKVIKDIQGFLEENDKNSIKDYAKNSNSETKTAYYQFLFGTCALVDTGTEEDLPFFVELLDESAEKNKPIIKALMNLFAQKHGHPTFSEFQTNQ